MHHQAKYQRLNANTLYVAAILFSCTSLHRESLPCLPNIPNGRILLKVIWNIQHKHINIKVMLLNIIRACAVDSCTYIQLPCIHNHQSISNIAISVRSSMWTNQFGKLNQGTIVQYHVRRGRRWLSEISTKWPVGTASKQSILYAAILTKRVRILFLITGILGNLATC